ncbi:MAG: phosphate ABC transporter substrate-binding/OmpA family protein [Patescibacteria group bacterium]
MKVWTKVLIGLVIVSMLGLFGWKVAAPFIAKHVQKRMSDAKATKGKIIIAVDDWVGYFPLRSQRLKKEMLNEGYLVECVPDNADYKARMKALAEDSVNLAVCTVDAFVLNGAPEGYPGYIVSVIDESKGGDAIVAYADEIGSLDALRNNVTKKVAFTPDSPSHHLIKVAGVDFDIPLFRSKSSGLLIHSKDSADALGKLKRREVSVATLWQPQVSKALEIKGVVKLLGSEKTDHVIVDVLLANRQTMNSRPEIVSLLLQSYFRVLKHYLNEPKELERDIAAELKVDEVSAASMVKGVSWVNLTDNARTWFGVAGTQVSGSRPERVLADTIDAAVSVLRQVGDFDRNPLPDSNPLMLTKSDFIADLYGTAVKSGFANVGGEESKGLQGHSGTFNPLTDEQWSRMQDVGTLKVEPIKFQSGTDEITLEGKEAIDLIAGKMKRYPNFRIGVRGHSDVRGDQDANKEISLARAQSVARYLEVTHGIDAQRLRAEGLGGTKPLPRVPGESDRSYGYRLPRVEIVLLLDPF